MSGGVPRFWTREGRGVRGMMDASALHQFDQFSHPPLVRMPLGQMAADALHDPGEAFGPPHHPLDPPPWILARQDKLRRLVPMHLPPAFVLAPDQLDSARGRRLEERRVANPRGASTP